MSIGQRALSGIGARPGGRVGLYSQTFLARFICHDDFCMCGTGLNGMTYTAKDMGVWV